MPPSSRPRALGSVAPSQNRPGRLPFAVVTSARNRSRPVPVESVRALVKPSFADVIFRARDASYSGEAQPARATIAARARPARAPAQKRSAPGSVGEAVEPLHALGRLAAAGELHEALLEGLRAAHVVHRPGR